MFVAVSSGLMDLQPCWRADSMSSFKARDRFQWRYFLLGLGSKGSVKLLLLLQGLLVLESFCVDSRFIRHSRVIPVILLIDMRLYGLERVIDACCRCCRELMVRDPILFWRSIDLLNFRPALNCWNCLGLDPPLWIFYFLFFCFAR